MTVRRCSVAARLAARWGVRGGAKGFRGVAWDGTWEGEVARRVLAVFVLSTTGISVEIISLFILSEQLMIFKGWTTCWTAAGQRPDSGWTAVGPRLDIDWTSTGQLAMVSSWMMYTLLVHLKTQPPSILLVIRSSYFLLSSRCCGSWCSNPAGWWCRTPAVVVRLEDAACRCCPGWCCWGQMPAMLRSLPLAHLSDSRKAIT